MLVKMVTASSRGRSAPIGTPALMACAAARNIALPPSACTLTSCTPGIAAEASTAPATVFGMSWNFRSRKMSAPSCATWRTASGPADVNSWLPILNMPTRSATCLAKFSAVDRESKSRATIRLLRGWASKVKVRDVPETVTSGFRRLGRAWAAVASVPAAPGLLPSGSGQSFGLPDRIHQFRGLLGRDPDH